MHHTRCCAPNLLVGHQTNDGNTACKDILHCDLWRLVCPAGCKHSHSFEYMCGSIPSADHPSLQKTILLERLIAGWRLGAVSRRASSALMSAGDTAVCGTSSTVFRRACMADFLYSESSPVCRCTEIARVPSWSTPMVLRIFHIILKACMSLIVIMDEHCTRPECTLQDIEHHAECCLS